jgi:LPS sulfotransferase NodH
MAEPNSTPISPRPVTGCAYISRMRAEATRDGVFGTKIHHYQWEVAHRLELLSDLMELFPTTNRRDVRLVRTIRADRAAQAISTYVADAKREYYHRVDQEVSISSGYEEFDTFIPEYDYGRIKEIIRDIDFHERSWDALLARWDQPVHTVWYEDLSDSYETTMRAVMTHLGAPDEVAVPRPQLLRQTDPLKDRFREQHTRDSQGS